jgi:hypothetical protein
MFGFLLALLPLESVFTLDCNGNGKDDNLDIQFGTSTDCNKNGIPDECDVRPSGIAFLPPRGYAFVKGVGTPRSVATADFDGDGDIDVVVMNRGWESTQFSAILLALNLGDGSFASPQLITLGLFPWAIAVGDFDGDGDPDLVVSFFESESILAGVSLFRNQGDATFAKPVKYRTPHDLTSMIARDLDGDQDLDLVGVNRLNNTSCFVLRNGGSGTFEPTESLSIGPAFSRYPDQAAVEDFNGDGLPDILVDYCDFGGLSLFTNDNQGGFQLQDPVLLNPQLCGLLAADFDGDSIGDLASGDTLILNRGDGTFRDGVPLNSSGSDSVADLAADMDGDGRLDIIAASDKGVSVLMNRGRGEFELSLPFRGRGGFRVEAADLNSDGREDLLLWSNCETITVLLQGTDLAPQSQDKDRDGVPDECEPDCNRNGSPDTLDIGNGASKDCNRNGIPDECDVAPRLAFSEGTPYLDGVDFHSVPTADFDGDGFVDLAVSEFRLNTIALLRNDGTGGFAPLNEVPVAGEPYSLVAADLDGDGHIDLATTGNKSPKITALWNNGHGEFVVTSVFFGFNSYPGDLVAADIDQDGSPDLLVSHFVDTNRDVSVLINRNDRTFGKPRVVLADPPGGNAKVVTAVDLDGDRDLDLAVHDYKQVSVLLNDGKGRFSTRREVAKGRILAIADVDGRAGPDLIIGDDLCDERFTLLNHGDATFTVAHDFPSAHPLLPAAVDIDGDGDIDLAGTGNRTLFVFLNDGNGIFDPPLSFDVGVEPFAIQAADFDHDGRMDLLATSFSRSPKFAIVLNRTAPSASKDADEDGVPDECPRPPEVVPGDGNQDGKLDLADAVLLLRHLFAGSPSSLPCERGTAANPGKGELALLDANGDLLINLSDAVSVLGWLFLPDHPSPVLGTRCRPIEGCPDACAKG